MAHRHPARKRVVRPKFLAVVLLIGIAIAGFTLTHRLSVYDWLRLRNYHPSSTLAMLAGDDTMTPATRRVFYVNHPQLDSRLAFAPHCPSGTEQTVVLGCYQSNQAGIYLLQVSDPRLAGIEQVTAAHETLHAEYDRMPNAEKQTVDSQLEAFYDHGLTDPTIKSIIGAYMQTEPHDVVNEMHSVFGTEVANLPPALEAHYRQYFSDRAKIVGYYQQYEVAFSSRQASIAADDRQLASQKTRIASENADLQTRQSNLSQQKAALNADKQNGNIAAYNAGVPAYNQQIAAYNAEVTMVQALVNDYNQLVQSRNQLALEEQQLIHEITSQPKTTSQ